MTAPIPNHLLVVVMFFYFSCKVTTADPQTKLLNQGCSQYKATNPTVFSADLNTTFSDLLSQLSSDTSSRFATAKLVRSSDPVYTLFQCRDYLSPADCTACFSAAVSQIRTCSAANGARVIYDGCSLRFESNGFFDQTTLPGNRGVVGNKTDNTAGLDTAVDGLLLDLYNAVPRINGFFAAADRVVGSGGAEVVHGVAQCARTVSESACSDCLKVAYDNIKGYPPFADGRAIDAGCFMRYSTTPFFSANQTVDLAPFLASGSTSGSNKKKAIVGGVVGGVGGLLLLLGLLSFVWIRRSRMRTKGRRGDILGATELQGPMNFRYRDLKTATRDFSDENKLGEGGFGDVYKGVLKNGKTVAVKKLAIGESNRVRSSFQSEVKLISNVHHRNLIRLLGCSSRGSDLLLVYEYMANSSLDKFLYGERHGALNWKQRFDIIVGMARGLAYLHDEFHVCIIHRDIKSSNILLDEDFLPKIADFGLARLLPEDNSHLTTNFAGTLGYTAPEYAIHGQLSQKVDTYSYGVVVLEIISGRRSNDIRLEPVTQYLLEWAWKLYEEGVLLQLVDQTLDPNEYNREEVKKVIEIALLCTQSTVAARPTMSEVVVLLLSRARPELQPTRPVFIDATSRVSGDMMASGSSGASAATNATVSVSQLSGR